MSYKDKVFLVCVSHASVQSGHLRSLVAQGADLALVILTDCDNNGIVALRTEIPLLSGSGKVTIHREEVGVATSFQQCIAEVVRSHGRLDFVIDPDGQVTARNWSEGDDEDKTQMLVYAAITNMQARRLRQLYAARA